MSCGRDLAAMPLDELAAFDRAAVRMVLRAFGSRIVQVDGVENIAASRDPFILVANHSTKLEALLLPALLIALRNGRRVHFLADWNFLLIPGVAALYRSAQVIVVPNKPARPRFLDVLRPLLTDTVPPMVAARRRLEAGASIGIFPEGRVNLDPVRLLPGRLGAAKLSLEAGLPVLPVGIRFPDVAPGVRVPEGSRLHIEFGAARLPPAGIEAAAWHAAIMSAIADLSRKTSPLGAGADHEDTRHYA